MSQMAAEVQPLLPEPQRLVVPEGMRSVTPVRLAASVYGERDNLNLLVRRLLHRQRSWAQASTLLPQRGWPMMPKN